MDSLVDAEPSAAPSESRPAAGKEAVTKSARL